jgi:hypothetical protein
MTLCVLIGCIDAIEPHLPTLIPYLINMLNDSKVNILKWLRESLGDRPHTLCHSHLFDR